MGRSHRKKLFKQIFLVFLLIIIGIFAYITLNNFNKEANQIDNEIEKKSNIEQEQLETDVPTANKHPSISQYVPIPPNSSILSTDQQGQNLSLTIESNLNDEQINTFYKEYFLLNEWELQDDGSYKKENKTITLEYAESIIKLEYITE